MGGAVEKLSSEIGRGGRGGTGVVEHWQDRCMGRGAPMAYHARPISDSPLQAIWLTLNPEAIGGYWGYFGHGKPDFRDRLFADGCENKVERRGHKI